MQHDNSVIRKTILCQICKYISPIFTVGSDQQNLKIKNGTIFFYELNNNCKYAITANHVFESLNKKLLDEDDNSNLFIDGNTPAPIRNVIYSNSEKDIVIFRIEEKDIPQNKQFCTMSLANIPKKKDSIAIAGYPGIARDTDGSNINFGIYMCMPIINHVAEDSTINFVIDPNNMIDDLGNGLPEKGYDLGGMSGSPIFLISKNECEPYKLCGVVTNDIFNSSLVRGQMIIDIMNDFT